MRLTCPNCSARYEVDESMIPANGRDVQCSNCSTTWFQPGPRIPDAGVRPVLRQQAAVPETAVERADDLRNDPAVDTPTVASEPARRSAVSPEVADILRAEAAREEALRRAPEAVQGEMALNAGARPATGPRRFVEPDDLAQAEDVFETAEAEQPPRGRPGSRRDLLPDIEEINSTLRPTTERRGEGEDATDIDSVVEVARRRSAVRRGFFLTLLAASIGAAIYVYQGEISATLPQAAPYLETYVGLVNDARFWLDDTARNLASRLEI